MIRDAYSMGADEGVILSDRKFAGSDVLATSYTLSQGIEMLGGADLILCGRQTTDGDTAQIGPAIAEHLHIPHCAWVSAIEEADAEQITLKQDFGSVTQISRIFRRFQSAASVPRTAFIKYSSVMPRANGMYA